jgi:hypothetical protein
MNAEHSLVQQPDLVYLHSLQPGEQNLPEPLRFKLPHGELKKAACNCPPRCQRLFVRPTWQAGRDPDRNVLHRPLARQNPSALLLQQLTHGRELGT